MTIKSGASRSPYASSASTTSDAYGAHVNVAFAPPTKSCAQSRCFSPSFVVKLTSLHASLVAATNPPYAFLAPESPKNAARRPSINFPTLFPRAVAANRPNPHVSPTSSRMTHARAFSRPLRPLFPPRPRPRVSASSSSPHPVLASVHARVAHALAPRVHVPRHACVAHPSTSTANAPTSTSSSVSRRRRRPRRRARGASRVVAARAAHATADARERDDRRDARAAAPSPSARARRRARACAAALCRALPLVPAHRRARRRRHGVRARRRPRVRATRARRARATDDARAARTGSSCGSREARAGRRSGDDSRTVVADVARRARAARGADDVGGGRRGRRAAIGGRRWGTRGRRRRGSRRRRFEWDEDARAATRVAERRGRERADASASRTSVLSREDAWAYHNRLIDRQHFGRRLKKFKPEPL